MNTPRFCRFVLGLLGALILASSPIKADQPAPTIELQRVPNGGIQPQIVVTGKTVHLTYYKGPAKAGDVFYVRSTDEGHTWSSPIQVNSQPGSAIAMGAIRGAVPAVGRDGRVFVVWNGSDTAQPRNPAAPPEVQKTGASPLLFARLNDQGTAFEPQRNLMTRTFNLDGGGSVAADPSGDVYVAWHATSATGQDESTRQVFLAISHDDGKTFAAEKPAWNQPTGACGCCQMRISATPTRVNLLYRAATNNTARDTYYLTSTDAGRSFQGTKIHPWNINYCPMSSYALEQNGAKLLAAWESAQQVYFAALPENGAPQRIIAAPGQGTNRKYPTLATNASGQTLLLWTEDTAWNRGGTLHGQLFDATEQPLNALTTSPATPTWSFPAAFARTDGTFAVLY